MTDLPAELLVSFWKIALDNFPEGDFRHRKITQDEAVQLINGVKEAGKVYFGTEADIGAPYGERELRKTKELVSVLREHYGVNVGIKDFFTEFDEGMVTALPITMFDIRANRPLLVTTCCYVKDREMTKDDLGTSVAPDSVTFHLFELRNGEK